jgi:hypothetical protein
MDNLTICKRCGSDACYTQEVTPEITNYFCYGCGFQTNTLMKEGEEFFEQQKELLPELYKDLIHKDEEGQMWMPSMINIPDKGMVFANGTNPSNWKWAAVKAIPVTEEEKHKYPIKGKKDQYYEFRMDMSTMMPFEEKDFMDALSYIEVLPE